MFFDPFKQRFFEAAEATETKILGQKFARRLKEARKIPQRKILLDLNNAANQQKMRLQDAARRYVNGVDDLAQFQENLLKAIKQGAVRMGAVGAGGKSQLDSQHQELLNRSLELPFKNADRFIKRIANNNLSDKQIVANAGYYAGGMQHYYRSRHLAQAKNGGNLAERRLDPLAEHCPVCPNYATDGFIPIDQVVPPGHACPCGRNCKCKITYRTSLPGLLISRDELSQRVIETMFEREQQFKQQLESTKF